MAGGKSPYEQKVETIAALRAENEFLAATLHSETAIKVEYEARIAELKALLRPFAEYRFPEGEILRTSDRFHPMTYGTGELTVGDFRRAAAALEREGDEPG